MNTRHTRVLTLTWPSGKPVKLRDIAKALRDLPADAEATSIEPTTVEYVAASHVGSIGSEATPAYTRVTRSICSPPTAGAAAGWARPARRGG